MREKKRNIKRLPGHGGRPLLIRHNLAHGFHLRLRGAAFDRIAVSIAGRIGSARPVELPKSSATGG
jgi:hypothetical protein